MKETYDGCTITLNDFFKFVVDKIENRSFASYEEATNAIDNQRKSKEATNRRKISVKVLDDKGNPHELTGIHAGNGNLVLKPPIGGYRTSSYLDLPVIAEAIKRLCELEDHTARLRSLMRKFELKGGGHSFDSSKHPEEMYRLEKDIARITKLFNGKTLPELIEGDDYEPLRL